MFADKFGNKDDFTQNNDDDKKEDSSMRSAEAVRRCHKPKLVLWSPKRIVTKKYR